MRGRPVSKRGMKQRISITMDPDLVEVIKERAEADDRSISTYINRVLRQHINKEK